MGEVLKTNEATVTTGQVREIIALRRAGAAIETALCGLVEELGENPMRNGDLADAIGQVLACEKSHGALGARIQEIIARLTSGGIEGKTDDVRVQQAKRLWDKGMGRTRFGSKADYKSFDVRVQQAKRLWDKGMGRTRFGSKADYKSFEGYLATIPEIPAGLLPHDPEFPLLVLVDPRLGLAKSCKRFNIKFEELGYSDADVASCDDRHATPSQPHWVRVHDGRKNHNRAPNDYRKDYTEDEVYAMTAMVAIHAFVQYPGIIEAGVHILGCHGSVHAENRDHCAYLEAWFGFVRLYVNGSTEVGYPGYGSGGFRRE
jgi:hypothetical protein